MMCVGVRLASGTDTPGAVSKPCGDSDVAVASPDQGLGTKRTPSPMSNAAGRWAGFRYSRETDILILRRALPGQRGPEAGPFLCPRRTTEQAPMSTRLSPAEDFPEDLTTLDLPAVEVLNSKIHRELDYEYEHDGEPSLETEIRHEELTEELDRRDKQPESTPVRPDVAEPARRFS